MIVVKAPNQIPADALDKPRVFLAGSIEMGTARNWQVEVEEKFKDDDVVLLNPRRDDWDWSWEQKITNPKFFEQVSWELNGLETADAIIMVFDPNTKSPISLLELGLFARKGKVFVVCPEGFWRKGNVDIVCDKFDCMLCDDIDDAVLRIKIRFGIIN